MVYAPEDGFTLRLPVPVDTLALMSPEPINGPSFRYQTYYAVPGWKHLYERD
jgi:hypothetical protein